MENLKPLNILITGATGYLGSYLAHTLNQFKNINITIFTSKRLFENVSYHVADWSNIDQIKKACINQDIVIHCASPNAMQCERNPYSSYEFNSNTLQLFLKISCDAGVKKFIYFSSIHVYGSPLYGRITEMNPLNPTHPYGISKKIAEETLTVFSASNSFETIIIRLSNAFGMSFNKNTTAWNLVVNDFCKQAVEKGIIYVRSKVNQKRNYLPLSELVNLLELMINGHRKKEKLPTVFNFGGAWNLSLLEISQIISKEYYEWANKPIKVKINEDFLDETQQLIYNFDKIKSYGYHSKTDYTHEILKIFENLS